MLYNAIMIFLVLVLAGLIGVIYFRHTAQAEIDEDYDNPYTVEYLVEYVNRVFSITKKKSLKDMNLSRTEYLKEAKKKRELRNAETQAAFGDQQAKRYIKSLILSVIQDTRRKAPITKDSIDLVLHFDDPSEMSKQDKFETILYIYQNSTPKGVKNARPYGAGAFRKMVDDFNLLTPREGTPRYMITNDDIDRIYDAVIKNASLTYEDKRAILAQRIFEDLMGFGCTDMLLDMQVDEVQGGVSGIPAGSYKPKNNDALRNAKFSFESVWVILSGINMKLDFMSFRTQDELVRICQNIYKYNAPNVLSRNEGYVVATMLDGSRVVVVRPEFSESYAFLVRKFDTAKSLAPEALIHEQGAEIPIKLLKWLIKGEQNISITGDQGTGKTTLLKSLIRFIPSEYSLRIQELTPELNIRYAYPSRNVLSFRETENITAQQGLDLQKKTSGIVNIIGEIADAQGASWVIQTAGVASKQTMFTNHSKTVYDLITSFRNSLMQVNNYRNERAADIMVAKALNFDVHMVNENGIRRISRITEIIPDESREYTYPMDKRKVGTMPLDELQKETYVNQNEYFTRVTDRVSFRERDLVIYDKNENRYRLIALPSSDKWDQMEVKMSPETLKDVQPDIDYLKNAVEEQ